MSTAISRHSLGSPFDPMVSTLSSPMFQSIPQTSPFHVKPSYDIEKLRELAISDEFSDDESDGVASDVEDVDDKDDDDFFGHEDTEANRKYDSIIRLPFPYSRIVQQSPRTNSDISDTKSNASSAKSSPKSDGWMVIDASPTFENMLQKRIEMGEKWFGNQEEEDKSTL